MFCAHGSVTHPPFTARSRDYIVDKEIGHGTFGVVYRAVHRQCNKAYAIKRSRKPAHSSGDMEMWMEV